jgi:DNA-binding transcriptional MerR regulator
VRPSTYDLKALCDEAGVTPRTVYYYIQLGLLPGASGQGPAAHYGAGHLARLRLIRLLQREHLPLGEIRQRLAALDDPQIERILRERAARPEAPSSSAVEYVREVLRGTARHTAAAKEPAYQVSLSAQPAGAAERSQWERVQLAPDVEIHVRRPLSREQNRRVDRLIQLARELFTEGSDDH